MYHYINGKIVVRDPTFVIIDVGGIGYEIKISLNTFSIVKTLDNCKLYTYFHVKEDIQALYGFLNQEEKLFFTKLIGISGIGPSTGLMILSSLSIEEIKEAIASGDAKLIQSVKGIGAKTAQRVILELKDKITLQITPIESDGIQSVPELPNNTIRQEAVEALIKLGIPKTQSEKNVQMILKQNSDKLSLEELIKLSLKTK